jgi:hypothetical protein
VVLVLVLLPGNLIGIFFSQLLFVISNSAIGILLTGLLIYFLIVGIKFNRLIKSLSKDLEFADELKKVKIKFLEFFFY